MHRTLLLLSTAVVAIAVVVLLWLWQGGGPVAADPEAATAGGAQAAPDAAAAGLDSEPSAAERQQVAAPQDAAGERTLAAVTDAAAAGPDDLVIAVHDPAGAPVRGVPVGVRVDAAGSRLLWRGVTADAAGAVRFAGGRQQLAKTTDPATRFAAVFAFPIVGAPEVQLDPAALPNEPVVLKLPPTGQVEIVIDDAAAVPATDLKVELRSPQELLQGADFVAATTVEPERGIARFPWVGLGQRWRAEIRRSGQSRPIERDFDGPRLGGQVVVEHVQLQPTDARPVLVMVVQDPDGAPLAGQKLQIAMTARRGGSSSSSSFSLNTDSRGVLRLQLEDDLGEQTERRLFLRAAELGARVGVPDLLRPGDNDLGVVRLQAPPRLCTGVVLDPAGKPIEGASIRVSRQQRVGQQEWWESLRDTQPVTTGRDGRFAVHGEADEGQLAVAVDAVGFLSRGPEPFARGADLQLVLEAAATVRGTVLLGDVVEIQDVVVELTHGAHHLDERLQPRGAKGAFEFTGLPGGTANVRLRVLGDRDGVLVAGVALRPGEVTADPRLQDVDLAAGRRVVRFTVVGTDGLPVPDARAVIVPADPLATAFEGYLLDHGQGRVVTERPSLSLIVFAEHHRTVRIDGVADGQRLMLLPALRVRLRLPADCRVPDASWRVGVSLRPRGMVGTGSYVLYRGLSGTHSGSGMLPWQEPASAELGPDGDAVLQVPESGVYVASWRLEHGRGTAAIGGDVEVTVADAADEQLQAASITRAQLERALEELRQR